MSTRAICVLTAVLIGAGCGGEQAFRARTSDGGGGTVTGAGGTGGSIMTGTAGAPGTAGTMGAGGIAGTGGSAGTGGKAGTGGSAGTSGTGGSTGAAGGGGRGGTTGSAGTSGTGGSTGAAGGGGRGGTTGTGGTAGTAGAGGTAGGGGTAGAGGSGGTAGTCGATGGGTGTGPFTCPAIICGSLDATDGAQIGRESRVPAATVCGMTKGFPGDSADPVANGNAHYYDVYRFVNPGASPACFNFTLTHDGVGGQRYLVAYSPPYDPMNFGVNYLGDAGGTQLDSPLGMSITVAAGASIDVVVLAISNAPSGTGAYTLACDSGATAASRP